MGSRLACRGTPARITRGRVLDGTTGRGTDNANVQVQPIVPPLACAAEGVQRKLKCYGADVTKVATPASYPVADARGPIMTGSVVGSAPSPASCLEAPLNFERGRKIEA